MKNFLVDVSICNGCYNCQIVCKDEHVGNDWSPYAKPQPDTGQFWAKLLEVNRGTVPKVKISYILSICQHCDDAPCIKACTAQAIYKRKDGLVIIDPDKCRGHRDCLEACPYHVIYFNKEINIAQKCTGCAHLLDKGWKEPRCVDACPTGALKFGEESELRTKTDKAEVMNPEYKSKPRVYYLNIPKKFIAGTVYDPVKKEVISGASCTLKSKDVSLTTMTDGFGDFWFDGLERSVYLLEIRAKGFSSKIIESISTQNDVNLGDIALS